MSALDYIRSLFGRREAHENTYDANFREEMKRLNELRISGFKSWHYAPPPRDATVQVVNAKSGERFVVNVCEVAPEMNIYNLYWRDTKGMKMIEHSYSEAEK